MGSFFGERAAEAVGESLGRDADDARVAVFFDGELAEVGCEPGGEASCDGGRAEFDGEAGADFGAGEGVVGAERFDVAEGGEAGGGAAGAGAGAVTRGGVDLFDDAEPGERFGGGW